MAKIFLLGIVSTITSQESIKQHDLIINVMEVVKSATGKFEEKSTFYKVRATKDLSDMIKDQYDSILGKKVLIEAVTTKSEYSKMTGITLLERNHNMATICNCDKCVFIMNATHPTMK